MSTQQLITEVQIPSTVDPLLLKFDTLKIYRKIQREFKHNFPGSVSLTHREFASTREEKLFGGHGTLDMSRNGAPKGKEEQFTQFNSEFNNTELHKLYKELNIGRFRILNLLPKICYSFHRDRNPRYHFVVDTTPQSYFLFPEYNYMVHLPDKPVLYLADTTKVHSFVNGSVTKNRIHLVMEKLPD